MKKFFILNETMSRLTSNLLFVKLKKDLIRDEFFVRWKRTLFLWTSKVLL